MFTYMAADGKTTLHGMIHVPVELRSVEEVSDARAASTAARRRAATCRRETFATPSAADRVRLPRA